MKCTGNCTAFKEAFMNQEMAEFFLGGIVTGLIAVGVFLAFLVFVAAYVYFAWSWRDIARALKYKRDWIAWIPVANGAMILQLGGFHWAWIFLLVIPILGWIALLILFIIASWRIFEKRNYPGWFSLSLIIPEVGGILYLVAIGFVAWGRGTGKRSKRRRR